METTIDDRTSLQIRRILKASIDDVYAAWTDPAQVKEWMAPSDDFGETDAAIDLRVGGRYTITMRGRDGEVHRVSGAYREIVPNRRLVYTWAWQSTPERESLVTVEFLPAGAGTELVLTHTRFFDSEARDRHSHGWNGCLERFGRYLSRG